MLSIYEKEKDYVFNDLVEEYLVQSGRNENLSKKNLVEYIQGEKDKITIPKKNVKVAKREEPKQEEFKPENKDIDNDAPVIEIAQNITVNDFFMLLKVKFQISQIKYL